MNDTRPNGNAGAPVVVQCIREIGPGGGVSGVAYSLQTAWQRAGLDVRSFSLANMGMQRAKRTDLSTMGKKLRLFWDVLAFSVLGTMRSRRLFARETIVCHNDTLHGSVYVNHGLHRAMLDASGHKYRMLLRNPLHVFLTIREALRFKLDLHDYYVCFSASEQRLLVHYYPHIESKIRIIPNGVDLDRFKRDETQRGPQRVRLGIPPDAFVMIFVGHEYERKGLATVIDSMRHADSDLWLIVVGGTQAEIAKARQYAEGQGVASRTRFLGVVGEVETVMNAADCLVMPSSFEAWPLVGLEGMACGLPALMTPVGGIPDYLRDGVNGYLVARDPQDVAAKVARLRSNPQALTQMRDRCVRIAAEYSWESIARRYLQLLHGRHGIAPALQC